MEHQSRTASKIRLFVALDLPPEVRAALPDPGEGWRRLRPESLHVTLAFLGWRPETDVQKIAEALTEPLPPTGALSLGDVVLLPRGRPRVMAVRLEGDVGELQATVSQRLEELGVYTPEKRPFLPHVTIGRAKDRPPRHTPPVPDLTFDPGPVVLYRSTLQRGGARYEPLASWVVSDRR